MAPTFFTMEFYKRIKEHEHFVVIFYNSFVKLSLYNTIHL